MRFDNRRISEIEPQEIIDLLNTEREDQWLDFKQEAYVLNVERRQVQPEKLEQQRFEMLKDISSMANAEGGYLILGVSEKQRVAIGFVNIDDPERVSKRIKDSCSQSLEPRIPNLEVEPYPLDWKGKEHEIIILHIPPSSMRPHCIKWKNTSLLQLESDCI